MKFDKFRNSDPFKWRLLEGAKLEGKWEMPQLQPIHDVEPVNLVPFHMANTTSQPEIHWFHFYEDDYQFERFWNRPERYLPMLSKFAGGLSPDFSLYLNMPKHQQVTNCGRNRTLAYWMQQQGMQIIPNACWSDDESLEWAFDGLPSNSVLSITTQGCMGDDYVCKQSLLNGLHALVRQKQPEKLIVYGRFPEIWRERFPMPIVICKTFSQERWGA